MKTILVSEFKAKCIATLKAVQRTREPVVITLRGKPIASIQPIDGDGAGRRLGRLKGMLSVRGDLVRNDTTADWEMIR